MLSLAPAFNWSRLQPDLATPMTGTLRWPRFTIACSAGKIFLYARSPVAPKKTRASDWESLIVLSLPRRCSLAGRLLQNLRRTRSALAESSFPSGVPKDSRRRCIITYFSECDALRLQGGGGG